MDRAIPDKGAEGNHTMTTRHLLVAATALTLVVSAGTLRAARAQERSLTALDDKSAKPKPTP